MIKQVLAGLGVFVFLAPFSFARDETGKKLAALEEQYRESLVRIRYTQHVQVSTAEPPQEDELTTKGVVVSEDGVVMASALVFEPFNQIPQGLGIRFPASVTRADAEIREVRIRLDGEEFSATLLGRDTEVDVAFFRIEAEGRMFKPVVFSADRTATVGQEVAVLSRLPDPLGPNLAVELTRVQSVVTKPQDGFLVSTGAADPVGSLVCDLEGHPLGMLDALMVPTPQGNFRNPLSLISAIRNLPKSVGRGFARPGGLLATAAADPPEKREAKRGWLGVEMQPLTPELASHMRLPVEAGIIVGYVYRESPAEAAGLEVGDVLVEFEGDPIDVSRDEELGTFAERLLRSGAGAEVNLGYLREGERKETVAKLYPAPKTRREAETVESDELDVTVREVTYDYLATRNYEPGKKGVVVQKPPVAVRTNPNRVVRGDLLVRIDDKEVSDLDSFRKVVEELGQSQPEEVVLFIERGKESFFFAVKPEWE
jgi:serine protease Do